MRKKSSRDQQRAVERGWSSVSFCCEAKKATLRTSMMEGLHQAVARDLFFSRRRHFAEEEDDDEDDEGQGRRRRRKASFLFSSFFKACCLLAPLKVVGCMYTACVCAICIATARFQLAESTDGNYPLSPSLLFSRSFFLSFFSVCTARE